MWHSLGGMWPTPWPSATPAHVSQHFGISDEVLSGPPSCPGRRECGSHCPRLAEASRCRDWRQPPLCGIPLSSGWDTGTACTLQAPEWAGRLLLGSCVVLSGGCT